MHYLFLDIASHNGILALVSGKEVIASREVTTRIRDHKLVPLIEELLEEAGWKYEDLTHIACVVGPGGFTSLRVAVSFANTLMDQLGIVGTGVHLSDMFGCRVRDRDALWLHATKRDSLFVKGGEWDEPTLVSLEEFSEKVPHGTAWMGELLEEQKETLKSLDLKETPLKSLTEVLPTFLANQSFERKPLVPWYGRKG